jgi:hypothetical protein
LENPPRNGESAKIFASHWAVSEAKALVRLAGNRTGLHRGRENSDSDRSCWPTGRRPRQPLQAVADDGHVLVCLGVQRFFIGEGGAQPAPVTILGRIIGINVGVEPGLVRVAVVLIVQRIAASQTRPARSADTPRQMQSQLSGYNPGDRPSSTGRFGLSLKVQCYCHRWQPDLWVVLMGRRLKKLTPGGSAQGGHCVWRGECRSAKPERHFIGGLLSTETSLQPGL